MKNKKRILTAAQKMRKALKQQRKNDTSVGFSLSYYEQKVKEAQRNLFRILIDGKKGKKND
ncbi:hypothetical protein [Gardnerella vaginalis]|uniref:hypothetical protein n=1 Tax=Gardnerella vaginalis TaxID=2702 RepID=UPI00200CB11F|nr:hypothetical protein [Gardnerella vaginalis]UQA84519.1 hypothetical protein K9E40_05680 [Gardnerella vaginalis]